MSKAAKWPGTGHRTLALAIPWPDYAPTNVTGSDAAWHHFEPSTCTITCLASCILPCCVCGDPRMLFRDQIFRQYADWPMPPPCRASSATGGWAPVNSCRLRQSVRRLLPGFGGIAGSGGVRGCGLGVSEEERRRGGMGRAGRVGGRWSFGGVCGSADATDSRPAISPLMPPGGLSRPPLLPVRCRTPVPRVGGRALPDQLDLFHPNSLLA